MSLMHGHKSDLNLPTSFLENPLLNVSEPSLMNNDYDQDIISAQDIESGKDITDITDVEKDDGTDTKINIKSSTISQYKKKKFAGEEEDEEDLGEAQQKETCEKRKVIEKSPKERFARFDDELGAGAIKRVFRGYDYDTGREVAWNVVNVSCMSEDAISKVQEEIAIIKKLKHPNIINFVSGFFNEEKKEVVIITEIFTSGSLKQYLNRIKHPRLKVIKYWCKEILKGLKYLHELPSPIIHRDIKCDNVFINSATSEIKIGDLGYSRILSNRDYAKSVSGTPEFMAPEVLEGKYGVKADIYSFGICMLEIVTREKPYKECENNIIDIFENIKNHKLPRSIEKIQNTRLTDFIKSLFKPESERPTASDLLMSEFLNDLEHEENNFPALMYPFSQSEINLDRNLKLSMENGGFQNITNGIKYSRSNKEVSPTLKETTNKTLKQGNNKIKLNQCSTFLDKENFQNGTVEKEGYSYIKNNMVNSSRGNSTAFGISESSSVKTKFYGGTNVNKNSVSNSNTGNKIIKNTLNRFNDIVGLRLKKDTSVNILGNKRNIPVGKNKNTGIDHCADSSDEEEKLNSYRARDVTYLNSVDIKDQIKPPESAPKSSNTLHNKITNPLFSLFIKNNPKPKCKIEIKIEEEYKQDNALKISLVKKEKPKHKGQKISFVFDLKNDTCEKIVKELESEKIGLNEEENKYFVENLSNLIKNHLEANKSSKKEESEQKNSFQEGKVLLENFFKKHSKIVAQAEEILKLSHPINEEILNGSGKDNISTVPQSKMEKEFLEKRKVLEEFIRLCH